MNTIETSAAQESGRAGFGYLLAALVFFLATAPFAGHTALGEFPFRALFTLVLLGGVATMRSHRKTLIAAGLAVPALAGNWIVSSVEIDHGQAFGYAVSAVFLIYITLAILVALLSEAQVTSDTVLGGVCVYLLMGVVWFMLYAVVLQIRPDAILVNGEPFGASLAEAPARLLYFSYATLTTLGYGDVVPNSPATQMLASAQAMTGQLFVAILIARLVGMHIAGSIRNGTD